ncbi:MAG: hypothetical protein IKD35_00670 [Clostridia bacterium]|nr:hypothetical protein [Clostridia bacterium]
MKIKMQFGPAKTAIIAIVAGVALVLMILDALLLGGVFGEDVNVPVASISLVAGAIILASTLSLLFGSQYVILDDKFKAVFSFLYIVEVQYTAVLDVRQNTVDKQVSVDVKNNKGGVSTLILNLTGDSADEVAKEIASRSGMFVEYYSQEKKNPKQ